LTSQEQKDSLVAALVKAGNLKDPGTGILFTVPVGELVGLDHRKGILTD
ncbi:MAG TPA: P-II family nitrogen regulator, partial [Natronincola sp.]|nr:P-II family nitrogen regulator [Natronincola sp.]